MICMSKLTGYTYDCILLIVIIKINLFVFLILIVYVFVLCVVNFVIGNLYLYTFWTLINIFSVMFLLYTGQILYIYLLKNGINAVNKHHLLLFFFLLFHISKCFIFFKHTKIIINNRSSSCILHNFPTIKMIKLYIIKYYKLKTTRATKINKNNTKLT